MRCDEVLKTAAVDPGEYARSGPVIEMPETSRDAPLERLRVRPIHEQFEVVIAFEHESVDARQHALYMRCRVAGVGEKAQSQVSIAENELRRLARVVRHRIGMDLEIADNEWRVAVDQIHTRQHRAAWPKRNQRSVREIDRQIVTPRQTGNAATVIVMFVSDEDGREVGWIQTDSCEPLRGFPEIETTID